MYLISQYLHSCAQLNYLNMLVVFVPIFSPSVLNRSALWPDFPRIQTICFCGRCANAVVIILVHLRYKCQTYMYEIVRSLTLTARNWYIVSYSSTHTACMIHLWKKKRLEKLRCTLKFLNEWHSKGFFHVSHKLSCACISCGRLMHHLRSIFTTSKTFIFIHRM